MLKMTMHWDHTIFRYFSHFCFPLVSTLAASMAITHFFMCVFNVFNTYFPSYNNFLNVT